MQYQSTRGGGAKVSAAQAIVRGLAQDGGLFVPESIPEIGLQFIEDLRPLEYWQRAHRVLRPYLDEFSDGELEEILKLAYSSFDVPEIAPTKRLSGELFMLELWHGPTLAFKDMALQLMPHLLSACRDKVGETREIVILVATSGDTGKAALEGFMDANGISIAVFYPEDGVSQAQRLQMVTQEGENTHVIAVRGNFDDAQTGVKRIFGDAEFNEQLSRAGVVLSSANSINLGRLLPQIVYYFSAYADMRNMGAIEAGEQIDVVVPTGNFGNILAAYYAREMGLPIRTLICASNSNNVLSDFISTGVYDTGRKFHITSSPSMDILISSNLERMLYALVDGDSARLSELMDGLKTSGRYALTEREIAKLHSFMVGGWANEQAVSKKIHECFEEYSYLMDTHTSVALSVLDEYRNSTAPAKSLVVSTASPYKFGRAVLTALAGAEGEGDDFECCDKLAKLAQQQVPAAISELPTKAVRHSTCCDPQDMKRALIEELKLRL